MEENEVQRPTYTDERDYQMTRAPTSDSGWGSIYSYSYEQRRESGGDETNSDEPDYRIGTPPPATPEVVESEDSLPEAIAKGEETPTPQDLQAGTEADDWTRSDRRRSDDW